ncbi:MAG: DUF58 domain-containing protein [Patescibacteria group bacterium]
MSASNKPNDRGETPNRPHPFLRRIRYHLGWLSRNFPSGNWDSHYLGRGYDYQGTVPFRDDPDLQRINWQATLMNPEELQVNVFSEERNVNIYLLGNLGPSMAFGSGETKLERLALLAAGLAYSAYRAKDYFRFIGYTDEIELGFPEPRDSSYPYRLAEAILNFEWRGKSRGGLLRAVSRLPSQKCLVVIVSDHLGKLDGTERALRVLTAAGHDVLPIILWDERETTLPTGWGFLPLQDLETGEFRHFLVTPRSRRILEENSSERRRQIEELFRRFGIQPRFLVHNSDKDLESLVRIFLTRQARL